MENKVNETGLEQMRSQLDALRRKLDSQQIVNDRLVRTAMQSRMGWIGRYVRFEEYLLLPLAVVVFLGLKLAIGLSWWFFAFTMAMCVADVVADHKVNILAGSLWQGGSMVEVRRRLVRMKELRRSQLMVSFPVVAVWLAVLVLELLSCGIFGPGVPPVSEWRPAAFAGVVGGVVGTVAGLVASVAVVRKMQRTNDELIRQIDAFVAGD